MKLNVLGQSVRRVCAAGLAVLALGANQAWAQLSRDGATQHVYTSAPYGTDAAYDPINNVYLVVGGYWDVHGIFVNEDGVPVSGLFQIHPTPGAHPRVKYSPDVNSGQGGFLVAYHDANSRIVYARLVAYPGGPISSAVPLGGTGSETLEGPGVAYSTTSDVFFVVWRTLWFGGNFVMGRLVSPAGVPLLDPVEIQAASGGWRFMSPSVSWNPATNEFGVAYAAVDAGEPFIAFRRVGTGGVSARETWSGGAPFTTNVDVNPTTGNFLVAWYTALQTKAALLGPSGLLQASGLVLGTHNGQDNLGLAYNPVSGTFLIGGAHGTADVVGAELNAGGWPITGATMLTVGEGATYYPRLTTRANQPEWNVTFSKDLAHMKDQIIRTTSTGGGPSGSLGAPPPSGGGGGGGGTPPPPPPPGGCTTPQPAAGWTCAAGGWFPPAPGGGGGGTPPPPPPPPSSGCTMPQPAPGWTCVLGGWLPPTTGGGSGGSGGGGSTPPPPTGCATPMPQDGQTWQCVNGGWMVAPPNTCAGQVDPFASMGGGTCVNGGWLLIPGGGGGSTPPPPPPPPPSSGGCTTPNPFAFFGRGTCVAGGWFY